MSSFSEKAKTLSEWHKILRKDEIPCCGCCSVIGTAKACSDCKDVLEKQTKFVRLSDAQQEIDKKEKEIDSWIDAYNKINDSYQREHGKQKQKLQDKAIRLLMLRAGGRYRMFEAGMLYQCLTLLGMQEFTRHEQVEALEQTTCHYLCESDAERQFERLLKH